MPFTSSKLALAVVYLLNYLWILLLPSYKVMDAVSNGVMIPVTNPRSIVVLVSASIAFLRYKYSQLTSFSSLLLLINKYSNSIIIVANLYPYIALTS